MKKLIIVAFLFLCFTTSKASHYAGAEISYSNINNLDYKVKLKLYRDCAGLLANSTQVVAVTSASTAQSIYLTLNNLNNSYSLANLCGSVQTQCNNPASPYTGYEVVQYEGTITLPNNASDWTFSWSDCCRNSSILNITANDLKVYAILNNSVTPFNNSSFYNIDPQLFYKTMLYDTLHNSAIDVDGDSLSFSYITPLLNNYNAGYSQSSPLGITTSSVYLNSLNGDAVLTCGVNGTYVLAEKIDEYRNGILIGSTIRDLQYTFNGPNSNSLPSLSGINNTGNYVSSINICPNANFNFTISSFDSDILDSTFITWTNTIPGSTITTTTAQNATATFSWTPTLADVSAVPYVLTLKVKDNKCPVPGVTIYNYLLYVNQCNTDSVWAGDANADFVVNNYDVLNIGIGNGTTGISRPSATTNWQAEYCNNWTNTFQSGINYKHADCNGDGIINNIDLNAINANYGQFHFKKTNYGTYKTLGMPDLIADATGVNAYKGSTINIPIKLGSTTSMMTNVYGIAATLEIENGIASSPISITNATSWLGNTSNCLLFQKNSSNTKLDFTLVRHNQSAVSNGGQIATLVYPISSSMVMGTQVKFKFSNIRIINIAGDTLEDFNTIHDSTIILAPLNINENDINTISLLPNPTTAISTLQLNTLASHLEVSITSITGQVLNTFTYLNTNSIPIDLSKYSTGLYLVDVLMDGKKQTLKVLKQ